MRMATPSFQSVVQPDHRMRRFATTKASGASTEPAGARHGRSASGSLRRETPNESGAPADMSTLPPGISPTSDLPLGDGREQKQPTTKAGMRPNHGTPRGAVCS